jgi:hypothetical protein
MVARQPKKRPVGRPPKLTPDAATLKCVRGLARLACTHAEAAAVLLVSRETFERFLREHTKAREAWERGRVFERISLRRRQFLQAEKSPAMAIWLGKQYLGQKDPDTPESASTWRQNYWRWFYDAIG